MKYSLSYLLALIVYVSSGSAEAGRVSTSALLAPLQSSAIAAPTTDLERDIAQLEARLNSAMPEEFVALKTQLNELYSHRPAHRFRGDRGLDQGADFCPGTQIPSTLSYSDDGSTAGLTNNYRDCGLNDAPDVIYRYVPPQSGNYSLSLCGSDYDTRIEVRTGGACPGDDQLACNDDYCGLDSQVGVELESGTTYYIIIDGYTSGSGNYVFALQGYPHCADCQSADIVEWTENRTDTAYYRTDTTGGCNSDPASFQEIQCGQTVCGRSFTYQHADNFYRDTDWYRFRLAASETLFVDFSSEFDATMFIIDSVGTCDNYEIIATGVVPRCSTATLRTDDCVGPGWFAVWVGPSSGAEAIHNPAGYRFTLRCRGCIATQPDYTITPGDLPQVWRDSTCSADDDCPLRGSEDQIYRVNIPHAGEWTFSLCDEYTDFNTVMYLTTAACGGSVLSSNNDACLSLRSRIECFYLPEGPTYLVIEGSATGDCGRYDLEISSCGTAVEPELEAVQVNTFALEQNYPNPFNPTTTITFAVPRAGHVRLAVYNLLGEEVAQLTDERLSAGRYGANFNAAALPSGVYLYRLEADGVNLARKMVLMK
jgi:hypothetical protein